MAIIGLYKMVLLLRVFLLYVASLNVMAKIAVEREERRDTGLRFGDSCYNACMEGSSLIFKSGRVAQG